MVISDHASVSSFDTGRDNRDRFRGIRRRVVCVDLLLTVGRSEAHEPRNGLTLYTNHHTAFDRYYFFIRFMPEVRCPRLLYSFSQAFIENRPGCSYS